MQHLATSTPTTGRLLNISTLTLCRLLGLEKACIRTVATWAKPCQRTTSRRWQARHTSTTGISRGTRRGIHFYPFFSTFFFIYFFSRGGFRDWDYIHECCTARDAIIPSMGGVLPSTYGGDESMVAHQCHLGGVHSNMSTVLLSTIGGQHAPINIISGGSNSIYADNCDTYFVM